MVSEEKNFLEKRLGAKEKLIKGKSSVAGREPRADREDWVNTSREVSTPV